MKLYDISMPIHKGMAVYKNQEAKRPQITTVLSNEVTESILTMNLHTGTHVDGKRHMIPGASDVKDWGLSVFVGPAQVVDVTKCGGEIRADDLKDKRITEGQFVLLKTRNNPLEEMDMAFPYLTLEGARYLSELRVRGVGIDQLGIERGNKDHPTHKHLFNEDMPIIEGLELSNIDEGRYNMVGLPLNISDVEAAPMRVVLIEFRVEDLVLR